MSEETAPTETQQGSEPLPSAPGDTGSAEVEQPQAVTDQAAAPAAETAEASEELLTSEEQQRLLATPELKKAYKQLQKVFTQKTQRLADERRQIQAAVQDPRVVSDLAQRLGVLPQARQQTQEPERDEVFEAFAEAFGVEWAHKLMPAFEKLAERRVAPYKQAQEAALGQIAYRDSVAALDRLRDEHPDAVMLEDEMFALAQKLQPRGMDEDEYVNLLYNTVKLQNGAYEVDATKRAISRVNASAASAEPQARTLATGKVVKGPPPNATPADAVRAALRGEVWE